MSSPASPPPSASPPGSQAAEIAIFSTCMVIFFLYHVYYFERHRILHNFFNKNQGSGGYNIDLWTTAIESRVIWAKEMIRQPKSDDNLLAMHTMRNVVIASTLAITGLGQVLGRLFVIITDQSSLNQISKNTSSDPIGSISFTSPEIKVGLATAILLISFGAFAQCARLSVHLSFMFRVAQTVQGKSLGQALRAELIAMTHRVSVYFTVGIRLMFLFMILISWCCGITAMLIFFVVVMLLIAWSDYLPTKLSSKQFEKADGEGGTGSALLSQTSTATTNSTNADSTHEIRNRSNGSSASHFQSMV
jgi:hypothetical protein